MADMEHLGLKFVHLPDTVYGRGKSQGNRKEAKAVAKAALEHFTKYPDKSLGIGTFNMNQQQIILDEVEMLLREQPDMTEFFESKRPDHFFVKNLETIQGDERDVIFISVGFGFDIDHNFRHQFGALNREGGERRLNVLITRAREKCVVFSNFQAKDLATTQTSPFGVKALKVFLDFAENRNLQTIEATGKDSDSPFEDSVYEFLLDCGYDVQKQVGCAGYRLDLAIVDPNSPGRYLLGIECDGAKYHSSPVARDRDRLRQQILENLGWTIYRIWSTDWYRNKNDCQIRLREVIEKTKLNTPKPTITKKKSLEKPVQILDSGVEREEVNKSCISNEGSLLDLVPEYRICSAIDIDTQTQIHELSHSELEIAIIQILKIESPVHIDEMIKRIRENHGLKRTGQKIKNAIIEAVNYSERNEKLVNRGDFLWMDINDVKVRRRGNEVAAKIEMICNEEIAEAAKLVLKSQHATSPDELAIQTSRLFGIRSTSGTIAERIKGVVSKMIDKNELRVLSSGMVDLVESR
jgi:very-short-patch-repair endonuclease